MPRRFSFCLKYFSNSLKPIPGRRSNSDKVKRSGFALLLFLWHLLEHGALRGECLPATITLDK